MNQPSSSNNSSRVNLEIESKRSTESVNRPPSVNRQSSIQPISGVNHSPLIPRRNDYPPTQRLTIQRQQRVCSDQSPIITRTSVHNNTADSGVVVIDECSLLSSSSNEANRLNRPLTLDLKPSFKQVSLSTASTNEDEDEQLGMSRLSSARSSSSIRTQFSTKAKSPIREQKDKNNKLLFISSSLSLSSSSVPSSVSPSLASSPRSAHPYVVPHPTSTSSVFLNPPSTQHQLISSSTPPTKHRFSQNNLAKS